MNVPWINPRAMARATGDDAAAGPAPVHLHVEDFEPPHWTRRYEHPLRSAAAVAGLALFIFALALL
jgi:ferredoxin-NADP reductase